MAPPPAASGANPLALSGNTQFSRQVLYSPTATTSGGVSARNAPTLMGASPESPASPSGVSWQGGAAGQVSTKNGGSLRFGALLGQNPLRWQVSYPSFHQQLEEPSASEFNPLDEAEFDSSSDFGSSSDLGALGEVGQSTSKLLNPPGEGVVNAVQDVGSASLIPAGGLSATDQPAAKATTPKHAHKALMLKGIFGLGNVGSGGPIAISSAKLGGEYGNNNREELSQGGTILNDDGGGRGFWGSSSWKTGWKTGRSFNFGGSLKTTYQFSGKGRPDRLTKMSASESISIDFSFTQRKFTSEGGSILFDEAIGTGWSFEQSVSAVNGYLPSWLGYIGYLGGLVADLEKSLGGVDGTRRNYNLNQVVIPDGLGFLSQNRSLKTFGTSAGKHQIANAVIGVTMAAVGPATAGVVEGSGQGLGDAEFENSSGLDVFARATGRYLWHSIIGFQAVVANQYSKYLYGAEKGTWKDTFFANAGVAFPLGNAINLLSYLHTWSTAPAAEPASEPASEPATVSSLESAHGVTPAPSAATTPTSKGAYVPAPTGSDYPFIYTPAPASNSYFAPPALDTNNPDPNNPYLLGGSTDSLQYFTLATYNGLVDYNSINRSSAVKLVNAGAGLKNGNYSDIPLLGVTADGSTLGSASSSFTVANGSIVASSFQITSGGNYLALPETEPGSGIYALIPDVFSGGIATPPSPADLQQGNSYHNLPVITVATGKQGSPLSAQTINRVQAVVVQPGDQSPSIIYPKYDPSRPDPTSFPAANNTSPYTYSAIPVQLVATAKGSSTSTAVQSLNPGQVTATVYLSAGVIQRVELDQALLFVPQPSSSTITLQLSLPTAILDTLPPNTITSFGVEPEQAAFNNFVTDDQFSAQTGLANAGVYIAEGLSDQIPLYASMGRWPVQNRVTYVIADPTTKIWETVYLNGLEKSTATGQYVSKPSLSLSDLYPGQIYNDAPIYFTAASSPTAITIDGAAGATYKGDTFVAWVEAAEPVIPLSAGDGASNFQAFMDSLYGNQRINYRIHTSKGWVSPSLDQLYSPSSSSSSPAVIRHLKAFNVANSDASGGLATLLVWAETPIAAIKGEIADLGSGPSVSTVIKAGWINPSATSFQWDELVTDIQTIPWDPTTDVGLTINDISIASLPLLANGSISESPVVSWSQEVRTPYRQSVLNDDPLLYLQFGELQSGLNSINIGSIQDPTTTGTQASSTGLNFAIAGALPKSQATAVQNSDGTGVLSTGLGSMYGSVRDVLNNIPASSLASAPLIASFSGTISGNQLTVTAITAGSLAVGDVISGPGILAGTTITAIPTNDPSGLGIYELNNSQTLAVSTPLEAIPAPNQLPLSSFSGSIDGTTLTVTTPSQGSLQLGDLVVGEGIAAGTTITAIGTYSPETRTGTVTINNSYPSVAESALVATPGKPTAPYTIEFWAQLQADSNSNGAGLVAFGQPSADAVGDAIMPTGWLLSSSFVVDRITYEQAAAQGLITAIPNGITDPSSTLYGWAWGVIADGADTTAMNGTSGSNLFSNALQINNLVSGATLAGINQFLANYKLTSSDLIGIDQTNASTVASVPTTQLLFNHALDATTGQPISTLNGIAVDTSSAILNQGLMSADTLATNPNGTNLTTMFEALWDFQQKTGEAKVNLSLAPDSTNVTTTTAGSLPNGYTNEQYSGYQLGFSLFNGSAVSVNGDGQLVFDIGKNTSITTDLPSDLRDGAWHYIVASYLPTYQSYTVSGTTVQLPSNVGTASLYVDNQLAASQSNIINAYAPINLNDQALLLANNVGGAIDQLAFYDKALSPAAPPAGSGNWPMPTTADALAMLAAMGYGIDTKTPDPGAIPGAVSSHWAARTVNPNDALLGTYYSTFTPTAGVNGFSGTWSQASNLNPSQAPQATTPSASRPGSLQDNLVIVVPVDSWANSDWILNSTSSEASFFNPSGQHLSSVSVTLTSTSNSGDTSSSTFTLRPDQVLLGDQTLQSLQPQATASGVNGATSTDYNYFVPTNLPAFKLLVDKDQLPDGNSFASVSYTFSFIKTTGATQTVQTVSPFAASLSGSISGNQLKVSELTGLLAVGDLLSAPGVAAGTFITGIVKPFDPSAQTGTYTVSINQSVATVTMAVQASVNAVGSDLASVKSQGYATSGEISASQRYSSTIATAAVIEQAPLQLKYIDSGEVFKSASSTAAANSPASTSPANTFGQSQVSGSFVASGATHSGWLAIAQPLSSNATSNPAGRVWINYTGDFTVNSVTGAHQAATSSAQAPSTWLNALAQSNFSPDAPNLPLLGNAFNPSSSGGLLIQADPTVGWGENFGQTMLVADVNGDGVEDLVIAAPQANGGGCVYIIDGKWIQSQLTSADGGATLNLANPDSIGNYVTVLTPGVALGAGNPNTDDITVAGFGSALAFDTNTNTLWIGAPNYLRQLDPTNPTPLSSLQPIGALYSFNTVSNSGLWDTGKAIPSLTNALLGTGGTAITLDPSGSPTTTYWGSQFGSAIATNSSGALAVSAPGLYAAMEYSGTKEVQQSVVDGKKKTSSSPYGDGALVKIGLPNADNGYSVSIQDGTTSTGMADVVNQTIDKNSEDAKNETAYMQNLKALQVDAIAGATQFYNQAFQANSVGAVYFFSNSANLQALAQAPTASPTTTASPINAQTVAAAAAGGATFYGPNPWNVLGASGFGSSLALTDFNNTNSASTLAIGASQTGGSGALYLIDTSQAFTAASQSSQPSWLQKSNLGANQYLAHQASAATLYGAASQDNFANGLLNLGDVNGDSYDDLLIQAFNASSGAGNGYVLFGGDTLVPAKPSGTPNPATGSVAPGSIGSFKFANGSSITSAILSELGSGSSAYTGQGSFGAGDVDSNGLADIPLGSGTNGSSYITWGHPYLEAITNLQLDKLASNTGYMLDGLASPVQGSLRSVGDFNGDGYGDFISISVGSALTTVRLELGANTQEILADYAYNYYSFTVANGTEVLAAGDVNGDGFSDIALFIDQDSSPASQGAGSTTGILYGRSSSDLPIGSGFGLLAPVQSDGQPAMALPGGDISGGLTDVAPAVINVGNTIYSVVKGNGNGDTSLWFCQSNDAGSTWSSWTNITDTHANLASDLSPSLAFFNNKLYLAYLNTDSTSSICISSWDPASNNPAAWSAPTQISDGSSSASSFSSSFSPQLVDRGDVLGLIWVDAAGFLTSSYSTTPDQSNPGVTNASWSSPIDLLERDSTSPSATYSPIVATSAPSITWLGQTAVTAVNNGGTINVYAEIPNSKTWQLASRFTVAEDSPQIITEPVLATTDTGLALTYGTSDGSIYLQRLDLQDAKGNLVAGNPAWVATLINQDDSGLTSDVGSVPLSIDGNLLLANVRAGAQDNQIWLNAVPNLGNPDSTTWLNTTITAQLSDGSISQQAGVNSPTALSPSWSELSSGASPTPPVFAEANGVIYAAVQGTNNEVYWCSSANAGATWSAWNVAGANNGGKHNNEFSAFTTDQPPALAVVGDSLYLAYLGNGNTQINISSVSLSDATSSSAVWNNQYQIPSQGAYSIAMLNENGNLVIYYQGASDAIYRTSSSAPSSSNSWQVNTVDSSNGGATQTCSGQLVATALGGTTYLAYQGGTSSSPSNTVYLTSSSSQATASSWSLISGVPQPSIGSHSGVGLASLNTSLLISYADKIDGSPVVAIQQGTVTNNNWAGVPYANLASPGATTAPQASLFTPGGSSQSQVLVSSINANGSPSQAICTTFVQPMALSQLLGPDQTGSSLTAVGDVNNDGFSDLLVSANNVVANTASGQQLATGLRLISGAANGSQWAAINNNAASSQTVHLASLSNSGSDTPVSAVTGFDPASGVFNLSIGMAKGTVVTSLTASGTASELSSASSSVVEASALFGGTSPTIQAIPSANGWGQAFFNSNAAYGDLNGDGYGDYFDPTSSTIVLGPNSQSWNLWSIRAAGDVNGNGVDDVLLALTPQGPAYVPGSAGIPTALQSVLVDGSLFKIDRTTNTFSLTNLRAPLDPYNRGEVYDVTSTSNSQYLPLLQNWFDPVLAFKPGVINAVSTGSSTNVAGATSNSAPAAAVDEQGNVSFVFSGSSFISKTGYGIWLATQESAGGSWTQFNLGSGLNNASSHSPSATYYNGKCYVAYIEYNTGNLYIASGDPSDPSATWTSYQVVSSAGAESSLYSPALVAEDGRLALYFASNSPNVAYQDVRRLYCSNPDPVSGTPVWGGSAPSGSPASEGSSPNYTGGSSILNFTYSDGNSPFIANSGISATRYQGRTVLAFRGDQGGANNNDVIRLATAPSANPSPSENWGYYSTGDMNTSEGVSITTDQSLLYLTVSVSGSDYSTSSQIYSLAPASSANTGNYTISANSYAGPAGGNDYTSFNTFMQQGRLMAAWSSDGGLGVELASVDVTVGAPQQQSLAGYSIDGNIDVNGDGFTDILLSDPSDPAMAVDNQYVLFGGDYLNIASQVGTAANDTLIGTPLADVIYTLSGADGVQSNGGADVIYTGSGDDQISIADNAFVRIDAGSGFDQLLLQGQAGQAYDFTLNVTAPQYFAGTKLKGIELISSVDYGSNTLSFDAAAINAINPDRILFLTPDAADFINLSTEFNPNQSFDTSYGGSLWYAYAAGPASTTNPTLAYVRVPDGETADWLDSHVNFGGPTPASLQSSYSLFSTELGSEPPASASYSATDLQAPSPSMVAGSNSFGDGLTITAYRTTPGSGLARFRISRSGDLSRSQLISYVSSSLNSSAEPGRHYTPVAGLLRLEAGQDAADITVPVDGAAIAALRNGTLSLQVAELDDLGQKQIHLLLDGAPTSAGLRPVLSGLNLQVDDSGKAPSIGFRADINQAGAKGLASTLNLKVLRRQSADSSVSDSNTRTQNLVISEGALAKFDQDDLNNGQVELQFDLNATTGSIQLQAASSQMNPLLLSKLDPARKSITVGIDLTTTTLDALPIKDLPAGVDVVLNKTAVDFTVSADGNRQAKLFLDFTQVGDDLEISQEQNGVRKRKANTQLVYYGIDGDGDLTPLTYNARHRAGARFYDTDGDGIADFVSLTFVDGGLGDTGPKEPDGVIHDPSTAGTANLLDVELKATGKTLQVADSSDKTTPASLVLNGSLSTRAVTANQIGYVVLDDDEVSDSSDADEVDRVFGSIFANLTRDS